MLAPSESGLQNDTDKDSQILNNNAFIPVNDEAKGKRLGSTNTVSLVLFVCSSLWQCIDAAVNASTFDGSASMSKLQDQLAALSWRLSSKNTTQTSITRSICAVAGELDQILAKG